MNRVGDYALIGDSQTTALVGRDGSIDWLCLPAFDSGACFAALLGDERNGRWLLAPVDPAGRPHRRYVEDTLVLETTWHTATGSAQVIDFMPPRGEAPDVVRIVRGLSGHVELRTDLLGVEEDAWDLQTALLDFLEGHWDEPDNGMWEVRGKPQHFVYSKVMAWAGVDRAVSAVERSGLDGPLQRWRALRQEIHDEVCARGFDADRNTVTQFYGSRGLDASLLRLPQLGFLPAGDPRFTGTVDAVARELLRDVHTARTLDRADPAG